MTVVERPRLNPLEVGEDLKQKAYRALKAAILDGSLQPGHLYGEVTLAEQLGVSRTPVREAMLLLAAEGWIRYRPRRGVEVLHPTAADVLHYYQLRQAIEGYVVETLAGRLDSEALDALEDILKAQAACHRRGDWQGFLAQASRFHGSLVDRLGNPRFTELYARLAEQLRLFGLEAIARNRDPGDMLAEHRQLIASLHTGDGELARRIVLKHLRRTMESQGLAVDSV